MFNFPWSNFHELNLDWILSVVKEAQEIFVKGERSTTSQTAFTQLRGTFRRPLSLRLQTSIRAPHFTARAA